MNRQDTVWVFDLYVAGDSPRRRRAEANLESLCREILGNRYRIDVRDLNETPELWRERQVLAQRKAGQVTAGQRQTQQADCRKERNRPDRF